MALAQPHKPHLLPLPLLPDHGPQSAANPLLQPLQHRGCLAEAEVALLATEIAGEFLRHLLQTDAPCPSRQFPYSLLTPQQSRGRNAPFWFCPVGETKAQKLPLLRSRHCALRLVHLELESSPDETSHALHDSLPRPFARHVDIAIIRLAHETVLTPFQLAVEFVEHEIRQQRRQHAPYTKGNFQFERVGTRCLISVASSNMCNGIACFGKTRLSARTQMRAQRRRGITTPSNTAGHQRPREEWIEIPVPALVTEESFARAQELLCHNKIRSRRRTIAPSVVQGLVGCAKCGYALSRTSTQTSARKIHYYKCIGSDSWRKLGGPVCDNNRFIRQELLDQIVWAEVVRLLEDPALIQQELDRRLAAARTSDPTRKREQSLQRELSQVDNGIERLLTAYQEELLSLEQLRERMPMLRQRQRALRAELQAITDQANDRAAFLRLAETLTAFLTRLRSAADSLSVTERQKIVRLLTVRLGDFHSPYRLRLIGPVPQLFPDL